MTEEEAIEDLKKFTKNDFSNPLGWSGYYDTELKELSQAIKISLNLIEKQDKIIKGNECVIETGANNEKVLLEAIEKKDQIIDRMANCIYNYQICDYEITDYAYRKCEYIADDETPPCKQCIIEYFEKEEG